MKSSTLLVIQASIFTMMGLTSCSGGGVLSEPKAQSRTLDGLRLPAPADVQIQAEQVVLGEQGAKGTVVQFIRQGKLRIGASGELGLTAQEITIPAGRKASVISRLKTSNQQEYLYVSLHEPVNLAMASQSATKLGGDTAKISEGYVVSVDVQVLPELDQTAQPAETTPTTVSPGVPSDLSCSVTIVSGNAKIDKVNTTTINTQVTPAKQSLAEAKASKNNVAAANPAVASGGGSSSTIISGHIFRSEAMLDTVARVSFSSPVSKADINSVNFQLELTQIVQGAPQNLANIQEICAAQVVNNQNKPASKAEFARSSYNTCKKMPEFALSGDKLSISSMNAVEASFKDLKLTPNMWMGAQFSVNAKATVGTNEIICTPATVRLVSPLVMDFSGKSEIKTLSLLESKARFDLLGDGRRLKTGWINGADQALLAIDLNKNGRIDDGRELFGEASKYSDGRAAENGFKALAQYDSDGNGQINSKDKIFKQLRLWFDRNQNGVTDPGELKSLAQLNVTAIGVDYVRSSQADKGQLFDNNVLLEARFSGPQACGKNGCKVYDVYFMTSSEMPVASK